MTAALELRGISKRFGDVNALDRVDFTLEAGEIHALLGENGAGKSTLMRAAYGLLRPDAGATFVAGAPVQLRTPVEARRQGIGMVHQHFTSIPAFTVLENVALGAGWTFDRAAARGRLHRLSQRTGLTLDPDARADQLSAGLKQRLEVLKALAADAKILLLDEPSAVLSPEETETFLTLVQGLRGRGVSSVLITHKLTEVLAVANRVTILRRGRVVHTGLVAGETRASLAGFMLGEKARPQAPGRHMSVGEVRVRLESVTSPRIGWSGSGLHGASLTTRAGEIVGVAAVEGNGQRELLRVIAGLTRPRRGTVEVSRPVSFIPEDRSTEGLIGELSLTENVALSQGESAPWVRSPWIDWGGARIRTAELLASFGVVARGPDAPARSLSGGNQQRLIIATALERRPRVIVAENPTRGLDLRAMAEVHARLRDAAAQGVGVIVHLADLDELLDLADRLVVLANGVLRELPRGADRLLVGRHLLGTGPL